MELKIGKMTSKELAEWFNVTPKSFTNSRLKKLEILKEYADYEVIRGGVIINKIYEPAFVKKSSKNYEIVKNAFEEVWNDNGIDTCKNVSDKISKAHKNELTIQGSTAYNYTRASRNELYGKPFISFGSKGSCQYIWAKETEDGYVPFNEEEKAIYDKLKVEYFGDATEKQIFVNEMVEKGECLPQDAWDILTEMTVGKHGGFLAFKSRLEQELNTKIVKATQIKK